MVDLELLLFIEPKNKASKKPIMDSLTRKMTASLRLGIGGAEMDEDKCDKMATSIDDCFAKSKHDYRSYVIEIPTSSKYNFVVNNGWMGLHPCTSCDYKVSSDSHNYSLSNLEVTNSLCIHYLAFHRDEISKDQLQRVAALFDGEEEPTEDELKYPQVEDNRKPMTRQEYLASIGE